MDSSGEVLDCGSLMNRQEVVSKPLLEMAVHQVLIHRSARSMPVPIHVDPKKCSEEMGTDMIALTHGFFLS